MERRGLKRVAKRLSVRFGMNQPDTLRFTDDLAPMGLFIKTSTIFPPGTVLKIQATLPDDKKIDLTGKLICAKKIPPSLIHHIKRGGMGMRPLQVPAAYSQFLTTFG